MKFKLEMDENNPGNFYGKHFDPSAYSDHYSMGRTSQETGLKEPALCANDLMPSEREYANDEVLESFPDGSEDSYPDNYSDHSDEDNQKSNTFNNYHREEHKDEGFKIREKYQSMEECDLSYPKTAEYYNERNYDTKDTIDRQLEELKTSLKKEEDSKFAFINYNKPVDGKSDEYLTFQNTMNKKEQNSTYDSRPDKYSEMPMKSFNHTDEAIYEKNELSDRLGIMKSAAARMIASNYEKSETYSERANEYDQVQQYESEQDGFDSSTNNLISSSKKRLQHIDHVSDK